LSPCFLGSPFLRWIRVALLCSIGTTKLSVDPGVFDFDEEMAFGTYDSYFYRI